MMATALLLCATLTLAAAPPATDGIKWTAEIDEALKLSQKYHVPVLLHFSSDHCPPCRLLEQRAFKSNDVIKAVHDDYIPVLVNVDQFRQIAQRYKVEAWPTDILLNSDGEVMHKGVSPQDPNQYVAMLKKGVDSHRSHLSLKIEAAKTAAPTVIARSQVPQGQTPTANLQVKPFSLTGAQTTVNPSSVANRVTQSPSLQPQTEPQATNAPSQNPASPIQTVNPFFQSAPVAPATSVSTKTLADATVGTSDPATATSATDTSIAVDATTPSMDAETKQESIPPPVLDGFCPVTLHEALLSGDAAGAWVEGTPEFAVKHRSCIYWFKDEAQLQKFMASPDKYAAVLSGYDLVSFLREGVLLPGKREHGYIRDGKLFLFSSEANKKQFAERHHEFVSELQQLLTHREANKLSNPATLTR
jgi:thiol-disulfide isomerase/thioredoxin/YHS domain-containing protein